MEDDSLTAILVRLLFLATIAVLIATSFGILPWSRIFYSHHVAHFAAFYLATFATSAALPRRSTPVIWLFLIAVAAILEILRALTLVNTSAGYLDWVADASGSLAALAPLLLQNYRRLFLPRFIP
jgi:hypothetical protein